MLKQSSIEQLRKGTLVKADGLLVITMCFYPRGIKKELFHEYRSDLAPDRALFSDFKKLEKEFLHELAFVKSDYEKRFQIGPIAVEHLRGFAEQSREKDVFFICQCSLGERCHRELLLLAAHHLFAAPIEKILNPYLRFAIRMQNSKKTSKKTPSNPFGLLSFPN